MAVHTIVIPDRLRGREPTTIIWDDAAATVDGTHSKVPYLQQRSEKPKPVEISNLGGVFFCRRIRRTTRRSSPPC